MKFKFDEVNIKLSEKILSKYPNKKSGLIPLLDLAQRQNDNWLSTDAIAYVAEYIDVPYIRAYEVASFYSMFNLEPVTECFAQVCTTTPCWLRGSDAIVAALRNYKDNSAQNAHFNFTEVECLGACTNAPVVQIKDLYYENLTPNAIIALIDSFKK